MADIGTIRAHAIEHDIVDPSNGKTIGLKVTLRPKDDNVLKSVLKDGETQGIQALQRRKVPNVNDREDYANRVIIAAIQSWTWGEDADGNPGSFMGEQPDLTPKTVLEIIKVFPNFREQIEDVYENQARFFTK